MVKKLFDSDLPENRIWIGFSLLSAFFLSIFIFLRIETFDSIVLQATSDLQSHNVLLASGLEGRVKTIEFTLRDLSSELSELSFTKDADKIRRSITRSVALIAQGIPNFRISVVDPTGTVVLSTTHVAPPYKYNVNLGDRDWFRNCRAKPDSIEISAPIFGKLTSEWVVSISISIQDSSGKFKGAITAAIPERNFSSVLQPSGLITYGLVATGQPLRILARIPKIEKAIGDVIPNAAAAVLNDPNSNGLRRFKSYYDNVDRLHSLNRIGNYKMAVVSAIVYDDIIASWRQETIIASAFLGFILLVFIYFIRRYIESQTRWRLQQVQLVSVSRLASIGEMSAGLAHEINTPLATILMCSERINIESKAALLDESLSHTALADNQEYAVMTINVVKRIAKIVSNLRSLSRGSSGGPMAQENLSRIVEEATSLVGERLRVKNIELTLHTPAESLPIHCRASDIGQVLINVLGNAIDAVSDLERRWIKIEAVNGADAIELKITDSGHKIDAATRKKLFEPFFTTKDVGKGTGLGLSISQSIMNAHGGRLYLNDKSANTSFILSFPKVSKG